MDFLFSNLPPLRTQHKTYKDTFASLIEKSDVLNLATGYISSDSLIDLKNIVEVNGGPKINLCVGMHYFEGVSPVQLQSLETLDSFLRTSDLGQVTMVVTFPFHGKIACFRYQDRQVGSILGSSNLSNIVSGVRQYEADVIFDGQSANTLNDFVLELISKTSKPFNQLEVKATIPENDLLIDQIGVVKLKADEVASAKKVATGQEFKLPLKGDVSNKSGLNASFGKGRENVQGFVLPRSWYEVELIIPKEITTQTGYPVADSSGDGGVFEVVTDDGWNFKCKVSGDYSKNFRSEDDLKILGKWLKGRLENSGVLKPGDRVTDVVLKQYGRSDITMRKIGDKRWYLDFGVN